MSNNINIKGRQHYEENGSNQPSNEVKPELEVFTRNYGKGIKLGDKVLVEPVYAYISDPWEWHGHIFIMKNLNWEYGIIFVSKDLNVEIYQSPYHDSIKNLQNGTFLCNDVIIDYKGNPVKR